MSYRIISAGVFELIGGQFLKVTPPSSVRGGQSLIDLRAVVQVSVSVERDLDGRPMLARTTLDLGNGPAIDISQKLSAAADADDFGEFARELERAWLKARAAL